MLPLSLAAQTSETDQSSEVSTRFRFAIGYPVLQHIPSTLDDFWRSMPNAEARTSTRWIGEAEYYLLLLDQSTPLGLQLTSIANISGTRSVAASIHAMDFGGVFHRFLDSTRLGFDGAAGTGLSMALLSVSENGPIDFTRALGVWTSVGAGYTAPISQQLNLVFRATAVWHWYLSNEELATSSGPIKSNGSLGVFHLTAGLAW